MLPGGPASRAWNTCSPMHIAHRSWSSSCRPTGSPRCCTIFPPATGQAASVASPACPIGSAEFQDGVGRRSSTRGPCSARSSTAWPVSHRKASMRRAAARYAGRQPAVRRRRAQGAGIRLLLEPCNTRDIPGFYLNRSQQAIEIIDAVGSDNLFLQYDIYHMQVMEGDLARRSGVIWIASAICSWRTIPGAMSPARGEINYPVPVRDASTSSAIAVGSVANTNRPVVPCKAWAGSSPTCEGGSDVRGIAAKDLRHEQGRVRRSGHHGPTDGGTSARGRP